MVYSTSWHVCDASSVANFEDWAEAISAAFLAAGWVQTADTGQVMWNAMTLTQVQPNTPTSGKATYTYSGLTGPALAANRTLTITGFSNSGGANNGTFALVSATPTSATAGSFVVTNGSAVAEGTGTDAHTGAVTAMPSLPGAGNAVYEIWGMGDNATSYTSSGGGGTGVSPFYVKVGYYERNTTCPEVLLWIGTGTNGSGTLSGNVSDTPPFTWYTDGGGSTSPVEWDFSGGTNWFGMIIYRGGPQGRPRVVAIDRSRNPDGTPNGSYATLWYTGYQDTTLQTVFKVGVGTKTTMESNYNAYGYRWAGILPTTATSGNLGGNTHITPAFPLVGMVDNPCLALIGALRGDFVDGAVVPVSLYGTTHYYLMAATFITFQNTNGPWNTGVSTIAGIRWE
jgi:hypothetical protein